MAVKYYRPQKRGGLQIVSTKRFLISIAVIAAVVVLIILLATQPWNSGDSASEASKTDEQAATTETETVPATETTDNVLDGTTADENAPEDTSTSGDAVADTDSQATDDSAAAETATDSESAAQTDSNQSAATSSYKTLKQGDEGREVTRLQDKLSELGYLPGKSTGYYGTVTVDCVKQFQEKNGLKVDGIAGTATQTKLFSDSAVGK